MITLNEIKNRIRSIPDYPKKGIIFKDITPVLGDPKLFKESVNQMLDPFREKKIDLIAGVESRGFIFGTALAMQMDVGFVPVRKKGKLPYKTVSETYSLEYGEDALEIHEDAITPGQNVLIVDDLLATGGTVRAVANLVEKLGGKIAGLVFLIELSFLNGRDKLMSYPVYSLISYDME